MNNKNQETQIEMVKNINTSSLLESKDTLAQQI